MIKRLLRPLIPDRLMARYRLQQHSRQSRTNVDVFLDDKRVARRWLGLTPDTYRIRLDLPDRAERQGIVEIADPKFPFDDELRSRAVGAAQDPWLGAVVVGETTGPRLVGRRRSEPRIGPRLIVTTNEVLTEVGGIPEGDHPLPGVLARIRDAGYPIGLIPIPAGSAPTDRSDVITEPALVILTAVPIHDIGGGARSSQLALEAVAQGMTVALVSMFESQESVDLGLRHISPQLEQYRVERFDPDRHAKRTATAGVVIVEAPAAPLASHATALQERGWSLVYDVIDDWSDPSLGGEWFDTGVEAGLIDRADRITASAPDLAQRATDRGRTAVLVPNAVNARVFGPAATDRPTDLPTGDLLFGYHGSLYGDWFDWDALADVALSYPFAQVVIIGDDKAPHPDLPKNVHFLGLKAQTDLPAYLQRLDVGVIPFRLNETTHAVSPLKAYEYVASGVPVAAPPLRALEGVPGVTTDEDLVIAVGLALASTPPDRAEFIEANSWEQRLAAVLGRPRQDAAMTATLKLVRRPVTHWKERERLVGS